MHSPVSLQVCYPSHGIVKGLSRCGGKTQTITKPTLINLVAEVNAIPMPTAYPTVCQFLQDIPSLEDTSFRLRSIPSIVHFTSFTAHRGVAPFIQELPPIEDPGDNISESPTNASVNALVHKEAEGALSQFLQGMPSLESNDGILAEAVTVAPINKSKSEN